MKAFSIFLKNIGKKLQRALRRHPLIYAFVGGVGIVLFWRGIWYLTDFFVFVLLVPRNQASPIDWSGGVDGGVSLILGVVLLLSTGLFVSEFLSGQVLMADVKEEEKLTKEAERGIKKESSELPSIEEGLRHIEEEIKEIEKQIHPK